MFRSARFKLTLWYLLIIIVITTLFSGGIYLNISKELERGFWRAQQSSGAKVIADRLGIDVTDLPRGFFEGKRPFSSEVQQYFLLEEDLAFAKARLIWALVIVNAEVWILAAIAGYFLAGKTLKPIAQAMDDQQRFISDASHELRTPITALKTSLEVNLNDKKIPQAYKTLMEENLEDVENLRTLTNHLLDLMTPTELHRPVVEEIEVKKKLDKVLKKFKSEIEKNNLDVSINVKPKTLSLETDPTSLNQLVSILIDNAIKYTPENGSILVSVTEQKKKIVFEFEDTGIGISESDLPHIFDRFYRADNARTKQGANGYGLGLPMAKKIVHQLKGKIEVESKTKQGSRFIITLPKFLA